MAAESGPVCPACAKGAVTPEGTWVTTSRRRTRKRQSRRKRTRTSRETLRPPTHGTSPQDRPDTIRPGWQRVGGDLGKHPKAPTIAPNDPLAPGAYAPQIQPPAQVGEVEPGRGDGRPKKLRPKEPPHFGLVGSVTWEA